MRDKNTSAAEGRAAVELQPVARAGRAALGLPAGTGCVPGGLLLHPRCREGGQPRAANHCCSESDQRSIFAVSDKDCLQVLVEH